MIHMSTVKELHILRYVLDSIPEAKKSILSCLYPFEVAKLLQVTGHELTAREASIYVNPLYDIMRVPRVVRAYHKAGVRMILVGGCLEVIKHRVKDPQSFSPFYRTAELGVVAFLFTDGSTAPRPMYRFVYDEGKKSEATKREEFDAKMYMRLMNTSYGGVGQYHVYHSHYSRTSLMISPASHDTATVVFVPDEGDLRKNVVVLEQNTVPNLYTTRDGRRCLAWAEVVCSTEHPDSHEIGPINYALCSEDEERDDGFIPPQGRAAEYYKNIVISSDGDNTETSAAVYKIPIRR